MLMNVYFAFEWYCWYFHNHSFEYLQVMSKYMFPVLRWVTRPHWPHCCHANYRMSVYIYLLHESQRGIDETTCDCRTINSFDIHLMIYFLESNWFNWLLLCSNIDCVCCADGMVWVNMGMGIFRTETCIVLPFCWMISSVIGMQTALVWIRLFDNTVRW